MAEPTAPTPADGHTVVAVVVTHNRVDSLSRSVGAIASQTRRPDHLIVVDNAAQEAAEKALADCPVPVTYLPSRRNLGGAGGYALGMLHALALGATLVWLGDDDGAPAGERTLAVLIDLLESRDLAEVSPVVVDADDVDRLAFPLRRGLRWRRRREDLGETFLPGIASLFNGALFRAETIESIGVPDLRLFMRGDEVEMHRRLVRSGLPFGTSLEARYAHPSGTEEFKPMLGGLMSAQDPADAGKRYYTYRNRGYLMAQPGMRWLRPLEIVRFGWYFIVDKRSPREFREWRRLTGMGRRERFSRR
jgi:rhamnopyranosyl-N-acetylglucosaminyl-diphospho-decaprenol beta-1,3/1,4-galactofuranosyltransferase